MPSSRTQPSAVSRLQGALAWLLAGLVLALGLLTVCPSAHAHLHDHHETTQDGLPVTHDDSGCAIVLFQHGVTTPMDLPRLTVPPAAWIATLPPAGDFRPFSAPRHLLQPARGPPCIG
ncbi:MAG: hypothetical protein K0R17_113 [Rariglobus sp.]|jgi:hypothetical protein|nr:hypothetical protein [Rariglobus sp.]